MQTYDLILCECICGRRQGFPAPPQSELTGFFCDECLTRYQFEDGLEPSRIELTDADGRDYALGFRVFSVCRTNAEFAQEVVERWFERAPDDEPEEDIEPESEVSGDPILQALRDRAERQTTT